MAERSNKRTKEFFKEWLEKLQQESWQLELLISGLALFGIWESRAMLDGFGDYIELNASGALSGLVNNFYTFLRISWIIFFLNLLIHIIVRGLWIGAIGLRYVSGDIDYKALGYTERFEKFLVKNVGDFDDYIEKLEKLSSIIFSFTFLLLFFFLSILSLLAFMGLVIQFFSKGLDIENTTLAVSFGMSMFLLCLIVFIDFITFGSLKRVDSPFFTKIYYWIYRLVGMLTLSFLFRPLFYNFIDDKYTRRLVIFAIPYILFISIIVPSMGFNAYDYMPSFSSRAAYNESISSRSFNYIYYDDLREQYARQLTEGNRNPIIDLISIDAYEYEDKPLAKIFFRSTSDEGTTIEHKFPDLVPFSEKGFHSIFNSPNRDNEFIDALKDEEVEERNFMRRIIRGDSAKITEEQKAKFQNKLEYYQRYDASDREALLAEINEEYGEKRIDYYENYLDKMLAAKLSLITMKIDSVDITDDLDCSYFIHPNMGEKGILCYFPILSFKNGKHNLSIVFDRERKGDNRNSYTIKKKFPFVINRN